MSAGGLHQAVQDIAAAHAELTERGADVSAIRHMTPEGWKPGPDPDHARYYSFADPDGNTCWPTMTSRSKEIARWLQNHTAAPD